MPQKIQDHEGKKYLRKIRSAVNGQEIEIDVYSVLVAFEVTCPALAHCIKKLLTAGKRGKGTAYQDLIGAEAALSRAIELCYHQSSDAAFRDSLEKIEKQGLGRRLEADPVLGVPITFGDSIEHSAVDGQAVS